MLAGARALKTSLLKKKYLEKISLIEKVATFVKEFFSKNGRTWSEINKIDFKINERTFSKISNEELMEIAKKPEFKKLSQIDREDFANEIFQHATAPLKTPSTVDFDINIDDLLSFRQRGCDVSTGEYQFNLDLDRLDAFIDDKKLEGEQAKDILRQSLKEILPGHQQDLFDRTLNLFSQTIPNIFVRAMGPLINPYLLRAPENLSISLIKEEKTVEVKVCPPIVDPYQASGEPQEIGQLDVVISIPLDSTKVAHFKITRS